MESDILKVQKFVDMIVTRIAIHPRIKGVTNLRALLSDSWFTAKFSPV